MNGLFGFNGAAAEFSRTDVEQRAERAQLAQSMTAGFNDARDHAAALFAPADLAEQIARCFEYPEIR